MNEFSPVFTQEEEGSEGTPHSALGESVFGAVPCQLCDVCLHTQLSLLGFQQKTDIFSYTQQIRSLCTIIHTDFHIWEAAEIQSGRADSWRGSASTAPAPVSRGLDTVFARSRTQVGKQNL